MRDRKPVRRRVNVVVMLDNNYFIPDERLIQTKKQFGLAINRLRFFEKIEDRAEKILFSIFSDCEGVFSEIGRPVEGRFAIEYFVLFRPSDVGTVSSHKNFSHMEKIERTLRFGARIFELLEKNE